MQIFLVDVADRQINKLSMKYILRVSNFLVDVVDGDLCHYISITLEVLPKVVTKHIICLTIPKLPLDKVPSGI